MSPVGHYEIAEEIGRGPASTTYRGLDQATNRPAAIVAIDLARLRQLTGSNTDEQLLHALQAASTLSHPNIIEIYQVNRQDEALHVVTEFVQGVKKPSVDDVLLGLREIGRALDYAHRKGVVHGAVRPDNILLGTGAAKIAGFGFARMLTTESSKYQPPEQIEGREIDGRSDQFSMGVIAYECIFGAGAGGSQPPTETVSKVLTRALAMKPDDRFPSISDFFGALSIAIGELQHLPPTTRVPEAAIHERAIAPRSFATGKRLGLVVILCFLVAAAIMFTVRMNSGTAIPVQVIETQSAPVTAPPKDVQPAVVKQAPAPAAVAKEPPQTPAAVEPQQMAKSPVVEKARPVSDEGSTASRTVDVEIVSDPSGARIAVDGRSDATCHAPCTMTLPVGRHTLMAQLAGYSTTQRIFNAPDASSVYIQLAQSYGMVVLTANLPNTTILIDGKVSGGTPATLRLSAGVHTITLLNGRLRHDETVSVQPDSLQSRDVRW